VRERENEGGSFEFLGLINHKSRIKIYLCSLDLMGLTNLHIIFLIS
jgi:hypothetical protein